MMLKYRHTFKSLQKPHCYFMSLVGRIKLTITLLWADLEEKRELMADSVHMSQHVF